MYLPLIGRVAGLDNAYVATAHSVWGILNAPATGEAMAEFILDSTARTVDLSPSDPARLPLLDTQSLRMGRHHAHRARHMERGDRTPLTGQER